VRSSFAETLVIHYSLKLTTYANTKKIGLDFGPIPNFGLRLVTVRTDLTR